MLNPADFKLYFNSQFAVTCLDTEILFNGPLGKADLLATCKGSVYSILINRKKEIICLKEGYKLYSDQTLFEKFRADFKSYIEVAWKTIVPKYKIAPKNLAKGEFLEDYKFIGKAWDFYQKVEAHYLDLAYEVALKNKDHATMKNLEEMSIFKFKARELLNRYFFEDGVIPHMLEPITKKFGVNAHFLYCDEIAGLFDGKPVNKSIAEERERCYAAAIIDGKMVRYPYDEALMINACFTSLKQQDQVKGVVANKGIAHGRAVIALPFNDHKVIGILDKEMKKGDILIATTTSPDIMMLCKKASAIVTDVGGMLSHAAIVSREFGIPCIIQTEIATRIFKTGDVVEVDGKKGMVRKI